MLLRGAFALFLSMFLHFVFLQFFQAMPAENISTPHSQTIHIAIYKAVSRPKNNSGTARKRPPSAFAKATVDKSTIMKASVDTQSKIESGSGEEDSSSHAYSFSETQESFLEKDGIVVPSYPRRAQMLRHEGTVLVRIYIKEGILHKAEIIESSGHTLLDESALDAIQKWQFRRLTVSFVQKITFQLNST